jgi:hypothetical protein
MDERATTMVRIGNVMAGAALGLLGGLLALAVPAPAHAQRGGGVIDCASQDNRMTRCGVPWRDAEMVKQESKNACVRNRTWGFDRGGIWVNNGCRGKFREAGRGGGHGPVFGGGNRPGQGGDRYTLICASQDNKFSVCRADTSRGARLVRQDSKNPCTEGYSWGANREGVWTSHGCRGLFSVGGR